jgi:hypothetical protein
MLKRGWQFGVGCALAWLSVALLYAVASYPSSVHAFPTRVDGQTIAASWFNEIHDEVVAIENALLNGFQHDLKFTDATYDIGKSGATRPRDGFFSRNLTAGGTLAVTGAGTIGGTLGVTGTSTLGTVSAGAVTATSVSAPGLQTLLHAGSGTNTAAGATNVDTVAITGLTAVDTLLIYATLESTTAGTGDPQIYNVTDSQKWIDVFLDTAPNMGANNNGSMAIVIRQRQSGSTSLSLFNYGLDISNIFTGDWNRITPTTAWTGSFTLALRHTGVTATGTFRYNWAVYKVPGQ